MSSKICLWKFLLMCESFILMVNLSSIREKKKQLQQLYNYFGVVRSAPPILVHPLVLLRVRLEFDQARQSLSPSLFEWTMYREEFNNRALEQWLVYPPSYYLKKEEQISHQKTRYRLDIFVFEKFEISFVFDSILSNFLLTSIYSWQ